MKTEATEARGDLFPLPGPMTKETPFNALHVWAWAKTQPRCRVGVVQYLEALGFVVGTHRVTEDQFEILRAAVDSFHWIEPHAPGPVKLAEALTPSDDAGAFWVRGMPGRYALAPALRAYLVGAGWIYDVTPETTFFEINRGVLWAKYQSIIGGRPLVEIEQ